METITKAIWGSKEDKSAAEPPSASQPVSGSEPISGETGSGTANEPYDAGNTTAGSENTFARDRGGPDPNNEGPHATSIANKLDPKVDSDGDGKPKSGPNDLESTSGFGSTSSQTGITGKPISSSNDTTSSSIGDTTSSTTKNTTSDYSSSGLTNRPGTTGNTTSSSTGLPPAGSNTATSSGNLPIRGEDMNAPGAAQASGGHIRPEHDQDKTGVTSVHSTSAVPNTATGSSANASTAGGVGTTGGVEPSVGAAPESGSAPSQKQQGADRPGQEPNAEQTSAIKDKKDMAEKAQGGDDKSGAPLGTIDHGEGSKKEDEDEGSSKEKGTGEIWIKSTGMAAEGGDFDAERAGAGKEADRLLAEKGIHHEPTGQPVPTPSAADDKDASGKPSVGQKIKEKLHIGKK